MRLRLLALAVTLLPLPAGAQIIAFKKGCPPAASPPATCSTAASVDGSCYSDTNTSPAKQYFCNGATATWVPVALQGGNIATATALAADPADCTLPNVALGINASGTAQCAQPSSVTGNAATATALAANPAACGANSYVTDIDANGTLTCSQPAASNLSNGTTGSGSVVLATAPSIAGGTHDGLTSLGIRSTGAAFEVKMSSTEVLTATRTIRWVLNDGNKVITLGGDVTTSGAFGLTLTLTGATNVTLPTSGTLATTAGNVATATALAADPADCSSNQFANAINASGTLTCAALTLAGAQFANQGTTTTVLHGNASGNPSFAAVAIGSDVSGLGTGVATFLGTPSSANLATALADTTGTSVFVRSTSPTFAAGTTTFTLSGDRTISVSGANTCTTAGQCRAINVGDTSGATASNRLEIGFGFVSGSTQSPTLLSYKMASSAGNTKGQLCLSSRAVTTNTAPTDVVCADASAQVAMLGTAPTVGTCGTSPSAVTGSDEAGHVTVGSTTTSCVVNFANTWQATPECMCTDQTAQACAPTTISTSSVTFTTAGAMGTHTLSWHCYRGN